MSGPTVRILVTSDLEAYDAVDISRATDGQWIRRSILSKLSIPEEDFSNYSIRLSEVDSIDVGEPLTDPKLFDLCQKNGDAFGKLKFYVSGDHDGT